MGFGERSQRTLSSEVAGSFTQSGKYIDPITVIELASRLLKAIAHDAKTLGIADREALVSYIESVSSGVMPHAIVHNALAIAAEVADSSDSAWNAISSIERLSSILSSYASHTVPRGIASSCKLAATGFDHKIAVATMGFSRLVLSCLEGLRPKLHSVNILEARPQGDGIRAVRAISKLGVRARLFPDLAVDYLTTFSDLVIVPIDTISYDGYTLIRMGARPLILAALDKGKQSIGLAPLLGFSATLSIQAEPLVSTKLYIGEFNEYITVHIYDKLELHKVGAVATESWLRLPDDIDVEDIIYSFIDDMLERLSGEPSNA